MSHIVAFELHFSFYKWRYLREPTSSVANSGIMIWTFYLFIGFVNLSYRQSISLLTQIRNLISGHPQNKNKKKVKCINYRNISKGVHCFIFYGTTVLVIYNANLNIMYGFGSCMDEIFYNVHVILLFCLFIYFNFLETRSFRLWLFLRACVVFPSHTYTMLF